MSFVDRKGGFEEEYILVEYVYTCTGSLTSVTFYTHFVLYRGQTLSGTSTVMTSWPLTDSIFMVVLMGKYQSRSI